MLRWIKCLALLLLLMVVVAGAAGWWLLRGSLPSLDGNIALDGLSAPVRVQRDALGVVTIDAGSQVDALRALGYVHAQERYFEMDLMRRSAAGELSELFGPVALDVDKRHRLHRMRARATQHLGVMAGNQQPQFNAYVAGVNAGLAALSVRPWPYLLLRQTPAPWQLADSALTGFAMYFDLQDSEDTREMQLAAIRPTVPPALFALLAHDGSSWDAPLQGTARGDATLPAADALDLRRLPMPTPPRPFVTADEPFTGSNNFAVDGMLTGDGRAIVADDMHLGLRAPGIWFRARLRYPDVAAPGGRVDVSGFTLPGLPLVVVGSNGHVAWGFTNAYLDTIDHAMDCDPADRAGNAACRHAETAALTIHDEGIAIKGQPPVRLRVEESHGLPVTARGPNGELVTARWTAYRDDALTLDLSRLATASSIDEVLQHPVQGLPAQNMVIGDRSGRIAWTLAGAVPTRTGTCDPYRPFVRASSSTRSPVSAADPSANMRTPIHGQATASPDMTVDAPASPMSATQNATPVNGCWFADDGARAAVADPASHRLWTANNRVIDGAQLASVGDSGYDLGARARQIRNDLFAKQKFDERDLLAVQLDDRALFLTRWWTLLRNTSSHHASDMPALAALSAASGTWQGRAAADSVSYRIVRAWRMAVIARISDGVTAPAQATLGDAFVMPPLAQIEGVAWPLITQQPANLLPRRFACASMTPQVMTCRDDAAGWTRLMEDAAREVHDGLLKHGPLAQRRWGERNTAHICHPLAGALPLLGPRLLCMPPDPLDGDNYMPRVVRSAFGASERMVVSPGHEADGIIHMPGGQSGHPLSPFWGAGHEAWVDGTQTPFLPGTTTHVLQFTPAASDTAARRQSP